MVKKIRERTQGHWEVRIERIEIKSLGAEIPILVFSLFTGDGQEVRISAFPHLGRFTFEPKKVDDSVDEICDLPEIRKRLLPLGLTPPWYLHGVAQNIISTLNLIENNQGREFLSACRELEISWRKAYT